MLPHSTPTHLSLSHAHTHRVVDELAAVKPRRGLFKDALAALSGQFNKRSRALPRDPLARGTRGAIPHICSRHKNRAFHYRYHAASFRWFPRC